MEGLWNAERGGSLVEEDVADGRAGETLEYGGKRRAPGEVVLMAWFFLLVVFT